MLAAMTISISVCDDADALATFFHHHWSANHVFSRSRALLDWQHLDQAGTHYNFMVAHDDTRRIVGMLGFIPTARFDDSLEQHGNTIWQSTWLVLKSDETKGQGQAMLREVLARHAWTWTGTVGLSPGTRKIYEALGYRTGVLGRYYLLNPAIREFTLAEVPPGQPHLEACGNGTVLTRLDPDSFMAATEGLGLDSSDQVPRKTRRLIYNRYVLHPFYRYDVFLARAGGDAAIIVTRLATHEGAAALRVVDYLGAPNAIARGGKALQRLLEETGAEYLDFYCCRIA